MEGPRYINLDLPDWYEDVWYTPTQEKLFETGSNLIEGKLNDFMKPLAEFGGNEFQKMLDALAGDTARSVAESRAARGVGRSGATDTATANAVARMEAPLRYADYEQSRQNRMSLFGTGINTMENVRGGGLVYQGQKNQFELGRSGLDLEAQKANADLAYGYDTLGFRQEAAEGEAGGSFLDSILGLGGMALDMYLGAQTGGATTILGAAGGPSASKSLKALGGSSYMDSWMS